MRNLVMNSLTEIKLFPLNLDRVELNLGQSYSLTEIKLFPLNLDRVELTKH
jgi:hypothetical protein